VKGIPGRYLPSLTTLFFITHQRALGTFRKTSISITMASSTELQHVQGVWERMRGNSPIYDFLLSKVVIASATKGSVTARLTLGENHINSRGTIHGAVSAALVDWSGGLAIATHGLEKTGASIDIHVTYIGTARVGETIEIEALANKVGRSMAFTTIRIFKVVDDKPGPLVATASHTKYISQPST
jgi:acyl-coenzyme A thioesterase 13